MKFNEQVMGLLFSSLAALILVVFSIWQLDFPLSAWIGKFLSANALDVKTSNIPDLLLIVVIVLTSLSWGVYFWLRSQNIRDQRTLLCRITGTVLPLSFGIKTVLKWVFGRAETRYWLSDPSMYGFHWFAGTDGFRGFPSGHMLVLTPLFLAMWHFYPRYRLNYGVVWFCLAVALIATGYHFLSDVIAGAYIGALVYLSVSRKVG